jgi:hypothetical protein
MIVRDKVAGSEMAGLTDSVMAAKRRCTTPGVSVILPESPVVQ